MATYSGRIRRGLPRDGSGEPWPPVDQAPLDVLAGAVDPVDPIVETQPQESTRPSQDVTDASTPEATPAAPTEETQVVRAAEAVLAAHSDGVSAGGLDTEVSVRRGLPRVHGGEPWPPASVVSVSSAAAPQPPLTTTPASNASNAVRTDSNAPASHESAVRGATSDQSAGAKPSAPTGVPSMKGSALNSGSGEPLRRGLPRVSGGEAWPPAGFAPDTPRAEALDAAPSVEPTDETTSVDTQSRDVTASAVAQPEAPAVSRAQLPQENTPAVSGQAAASAAATPPAVANQSVAAQTSAGAKPTVSSATTKAASSIPKATPKTEPSSAKPQTTKKEPKKYGSRTLMQWIRLVALLVVGAVAAAGIIVLAARGLTTFSTVQNFLARYPGEYELPETAEPGFPAWVRWSHFLNMFFIVLIIRSGLLVRRQQKPPAFWTPKNGKGAKISINLWLHQSLDLLWLINGIVFVVLLFVTGHWMRIVPTSWEVFPNALSALLQYMTLEWPVEDGWVNYNSLQQLMYFTVVFIAAPLAAITGARLSDLWPKGATRVNKVYPVELARALHFPTMLFFVVFVVFHVALVFSTGALKNLNHMYAGTPEISWTGFWLFVASIVVVALVWVASRPMILAPIANLFGKVSSR